MGRPPKNPTNALTRLRKAISTPSQIVTREILAERVGLSAPTIRDIETGRFQMTEAVARRIMLATGVSMRSLLANDDPLKDVGGKPLSPKSTVLSELDYQQERSMFDMLTTSLLAAKEKKRSSIFYLLFSEWLSQAVDIIGATSTMKRALNRNLGFFDPYHVPEAFQPIDPKMKKRWSQSWAELTAAVAQRAGGIEKADRESYLDELDSRRARKQQGE